MYAAELGCRASKTKTTQQKLMKFNFSICEWKLMTDGRLLDKIIMGNQHNRSETKTAPKKKKQKQTN